LRRPSFRRTIIAPAPAARRSRKNNKLCVLFFGSGVTGLPLPAGRSPAERGFRRVGSCVMIPPPAPNTSPPLTIPARSLAALSTLKPSEVEL